MPNAIIFKQIAEAKGIPLKAIEQELGMSNGTIGKAIKRNSDIKSGTIELLLSKFPDLNRRWLQTGEGEMFIVPEGAHETKYFQEAFKGPGNRGMVSIPEEGQEGNQEHTRTGSSTKYTFEGVELSKVEQPESKYSKETHQRHVEEQDQKDFVYLPVIELGAKGGVGDEVTDLEDRMVEMRKVSRSMFDDAEAILPVYGNSMSPAYPPGSEVAIARDMSGFFEYGDVYVIKIKNKARPLLKRVEECDEPDCILLVSDNEMRRESGPLAGKFFYPPQKLPKELIDQVWEVIGDCKRRKNKAIQLRHFREQSFNKKPEIKP